MCDFHIFIAIFDDISPFHHFDHFFVNFFSCGVWGGCGGVAGLHRLLSHIERLQSASVIIVCAGMEGALASVVAGLVDCPVIAVPTSIGYGANLGGVTTLLAMLNSCAAGVVTVNIDNGFGAAYAATQINRKLIKKLK